MNTKLSLAALNQLPSNVAAPRYDRNVLKAGILHFGLGNFHRAHQAVYLDDLFNRGRDRDFAVVGAGVFEAERKGRDLLAAQDFLSTVVEQDETGRRARVTGALVEFLTPADGVAIAARMGDPAIRIVSLTVTEGGYFLDPATGRFNPDHPDIVRDAKSPDAPKTAFGLMLKGLKARREAGQKPFTVMSCDNIPHNGAVTREALAGLAHLFDPDLAAWVEENVAFPNSMVDRITPATTDRERRILEEEFGVEDAWPVFCEPFRQWVLQDHFPGGRPALEEVGVEFVDDVAPFELMKIRILNGGHATIAYPGGLLDIHFVHEAMEHKLIRGFLRRLEESEIIPTVPPVPGVVLQDYFELIDRRFANPAIGDTIRRLCLDGSNRQPKFIIPVIADRLKARAPVEGLALESALWCRYCFGVTESGQEIAPNDPNWDRLQAASRQARANPDTWLAMDDIYGEVGRAPAFQSAFADALNALWRDGTVRVLENYLGRA